MMEWTIVAWDSLVEEMKVHNGLNGKLLCLWDTKIMETVYEVS